MHEDECARARASVFLREREGGGRERGGWGREGGRGSIR